MDQNVCVSKLYVFVAVAEDLSFVSFAKMCDRIEIMGGKRYDAFIEMY